MRTSPDLTFMSILCALFPSFLFLFLLAKHLPGAESSIGFLVAQVTNLFPHCDNLSHSFNLVDIQALIHSLKQFESGCLGPHCLQLFLRIQSR